MPPIIAAIGGAASGGLDGIDGKAKPFRTALRRSRPAFPSGYIKLIGGYASAYHRRHSTLSTSSGSSSLGHPFQNRKLDHR